MTWEPDHKTYMEDALIREARSVNDIEPEPWVTALKHLFEAFDNERTTEPAPNHGAGSLLPKETT